MSTRANILLLETGNKLWIYHHSDGYPSYLGDALMKIMQKHKEHKWLDIYELANEMIKNEQDDGFEITNDRHGDIEYIYIINVEEQSIVCRKTSFDSIYNDTTIIEAKYSNDEDIQKWFDFCDKN